MREATRAASYLFFDGAFDNIFTHPPTKERIRPSEALSSGGQDFAVTA